MSDRDSIDYFMEEKIGGFGVYQFLLFVVILCSYCPNTMHRVALKFLTSHGKHICLDNNATVVGLCPCQNITFYMETFQSISSDLNLVCEKPWIINFTETALLIGIFLGSIIFGILADRYGRKTMFKWSGVTQLLALLAVLITNIWMFNMFRLISGIGVGGISVTGYVLLMEFVGIKYREMFAGIIYMGMICGQILIIPIAFFISHWVYLQTAFGLFSAILLLLYHHMPESVKWLLVKGNVEQSIDILEKAAEMNKKTSTNVREHITVQYQGIQPSKSTPIDLIRLPNIRRNTITLAIIWLICGFGYFGLSGNIDTLHSNKFVDALLSSIISSPGILITIPINKHMGRKSSIMLTLCIPGAVLLLYDGVSSNNKWIILGITVIGKSFMITATIICHLIVIEYYPTVMRSTALGMFHGLVALGHIAAHYLNVANLPQKWVLFSIYGIIIITCSLLGICLTETKGLPLPSTLEESENI